MQSRIGFRKNNSRIFEEMKTHAFWDRRLSVMLVGTTAPDGPGLGSEARAIAHDKLDEFIKTSSNINSG